MTEPITFSLVLKTCDRTRPRKELRPNSKNYLGQTIRNLARGGVFESGHLAWFHIHDGAPIEGQNFVDEEIAKTGTAIPKGLVWSSSGEEGASLQRTGYLAIMHGYDKASDWDADYVLVLEDDVNVCARFLESVAQWLSVYAIAGPMMYVLGSNHAPQIWSACDSGNEVWLYPCAGFYGAQAVLWRREHALQVAEWLGPDPYYPSRSGNKIIQVRDRGHDRNLYLWGESVGLKHFMSTAPSYVDHIGDVSGIANKQFFFPAFAGEDWHYGQPYDVKAAVKRLEEWNAAHPNTEESK